MWLQRQKADPQPPHVIGSYAATKISWRGRYRRVICITPLEIVTFDPSTWKVTNVYSLASNDADLESVSLGPTSSYPAGGMTDEGEVVLSVRGDKKVRHAGVAEG